MIYKKTLNEDYGMSKIQKVFFMTRDSTTKKTHQYLKSVFINHKPYKPPLQGLFDNCNYSVNQNQNVFTSIQCLCIIDDFQVISLVFRTSPGG